MFSKLLKVLKYKRITNPPEEGKSIESSKEAVAVNSNYSLGMNINDYESDLQVFSPNFNSGVIEEITGYSQEDFEKGHITWDKIVHPEDLPLFYQEDQKLKNKKGYVFNIEYRIIRKNGRIRWVKDIGQVLANPTELSPWLIGNICDITDKKLQDKRTVDKA